MATTRNKVMWRKQTLMRPHHLQQQQRVGNDYVNNLRFRAIHDLSRNLPSFLNDELLGQGKISDRQRVGAPCRTAPCFPFRTVMRSPIRCIRTVFLMRKPQCLSGLYPLPAM